MYVSANSRTFCDSKAILYDIIVYNESFVK